MLFFFHGGGMVADAPEEDVGDVLIGHHFLASSRVPRQSLRLGSSEEGWLGPEQAVEVCFLFGAGPRRGYSRR